MAGYIHSSKMRSSHTGMWGLGRWGGAWPPSDCPRYLCYYH